MEEHPGPPLNHVARGAVVGLFRASKNQNHIFSLAIVRVKSGFEKIHGNWNNLLPTEMYPEY
jgi:hypothetical protein